MMKTRKFKRIIGAVTASVLALSVIPFVHIMNNSLTVSADGNFTKSAANTTLGTSGIQPPSNDENNTEWTGNYVYYGKYNNTSQSSKRTSGPER